MANAEKKIERCFSENHQQISSKRGRHPASQKLLPFAPLNNNSNKPKLFTKLTFSLSLSLSFPLFLSLSWSSNLVDGEYKQKSATQTPSGHLSTTSEVEISCKPGATAGVSASVAASCSTDSGAYQSSKVSWHSPAHKT